MKAAVWKSAIVRENENLDLSIIVPFNQKDEAVILEYLEEYLCMIGCEAGNLTTDHFEFSHYEDMQERWMEIIHRKGCYIVER